MKYVLNKLHGVEVPILAAIQLILDVGINKLSANDMPNKLIVVSDMQFDSVENNCTSWSSTSLGSNNINYVYLIVWVQTSVENLQ